MSTTYTLLNGFTMAIGFVLSIIALILLMTGAEGGLLLITGILVILVGLQGWQYIQLLVRVDELSEKLDSMK
ncbi:MAG: hypothetical protein ACXAE3_01460 [Candidatus Kariarchaeaceae archaeon]|jgi:hypothetical protein